MKEYVFVEFLFTLSEYKSELSKLRDLDDDFDLLTVGPEPRDSTHGDREECLRVSAKINSETATMIKLRNPVLSGKMRISYIPDDLKTNTENEILLRKVDRIKINS